MGWSSKNLNLAPPSTHPRTPTSTPIVRTLRHLLGLFHSRHVQQVKPLRLDPPPRSRIKGWNTATTKQWKKVPNGCLGKMSWMNSYCCYEGIFLNKPWHKDPIIKQPGWLMESKKFFFRGSKEPIRKFWDPQIFRYSDFSEISIQILCRMLVGWIKYTSRDSFYGLSSRSPEFIRVILFFKFPAPETNS